MVVLGQKVGLVSEETASAMIMDMDRMNEKSKQKTNKWISDVVNAGLESVGKKSSDIQEELEALQYKAGEAEREKIRKAAFDKFVSDAKQMAGQAYDAVMQFFNPRQAAIGPENEFTAEFGAVGAGSATQLQSSLSKQQNDLQKDQLKESIKTNKTLEEIRDQKRGVWGI